MSTLLAIGIGAALGALAGRLALSVWLEARRRERFVWSPWMSPAQIDRENGLDPLEGPPEVPLALVKASCDWHDEGGYGFVWTCPACQRAQADDPVTTMDEGEGLLW